MFVHFCSERSSRSDRIVFQGDHTPDLPTSQWQGRVITSATVTVPEECIGGGYDIRVGLHRNGRANLRGKLDDERRAMVGKLVVKPGDIHLQAVEYDEEEPVEYNAARAVVDFGPVQTNGSMRITLEDRALLVTPLPGDPAAEVALDLATLFGGDGLLRVSRIVVIDERGADAGELGFEQEGSTVRLVTRTGDFQYRLEP